MFKVLNLKAQTLNTAGTSYSQVLDLTSIGGNDVQATLDINSLTGSGVTFDVTPEYSYDAVEWFDEGTSNVFTQVIASGAHESLNMSFTALYVRFKYVVVGTSPNINFDLYVRAAVGSSPSNVAGGSGGSTVLDPVATSIATGRKIITVANTPQQLSAVSTTAKTILISSLFSNTGRVWIGDASVSSTGGSQAGTPLEAGQYIEIQIDNLNKLYVAGNLNDVVTYSYLN